MQLTPNIIKGIYTMLLQCRPFNGWTLLPHPDSVKFVVESSIEEVGFYIYDEGEEIEHVLGISRDGCGHLDTVVKTIAHEMIHMKRHKTSKWTDHDAIFRKYAHQVSAELGFDPLEL